MSAIADPWTIKATSGSGEGGYTPCEAGTYPATIVAIFDIGTQATSYKGEAKNVRQLVVCYELDETDPQGKPYVLADKFNYSLFSMATFSAWVTTLTGRTLADGEVLNIREFVGMGLQVTVSHKQVSKDGKTKTYHQVAGVSRLGKKMTPPENTLEPVLWSVLTGEPFPERDWFPRVYGQTIASLASESQEVRQRAHNNSVLNDTHDGDDIPF